MRTLRRLTAAAVSACLVLSSVPATAQGVPAPTDAAQSGAAAQAAPGRARNVILFLADAGGVPTLSAASLLGYGEPLRLHVQGWPHLGLSETSPVDAFVSDSANHDSTVPELWVYRP